MWEYRAALPTYSGRSMSSDKIIHDGDTVRLLVDLGFDQRAEKWIRLADTRAPEVKPMQPGGAETRLYVVEWLTKATSYGLNWPLRVITEITHTAEPTEVESISRYVGWVYDIRSGACLNEAVTRYLAGHPEWPRGN